MLTNCKAQVRIAFNPILPRSVHLVKSIYSALDPNTLFSGHPEINSTSSVTNEHDVRRIDLDIQTQSIANLRASLNSYLQLFGISLNVINRV
jgi:tRNA threonylcarbamoyladenosine modification (KEOPS) complex  Pcc1 subunit